MEGSLSVSLVPVLILVVIDSQPAHGRLINNICTSTYMAYARYKQISTSKSNHTARGTGLRPSSIQRGRTGRQEIVKY